MGSLAKGNRELALILALGLGIRVLWMIAAGTTWQPLDLGEATSAAQHFARDGWIADGFFPGQGPTAHLLPTMIVIAGWVFRVLGPQSGLANLTLAAWALAQSFASYLLVRALFARIGADRAVQRAGLVILCLLPVFVVQEACDFRFWEGALGLCLAACNLFLLERFDREGFGSWRGLALAAILSAVTFFVSPAAGVAVDLCWAVYALRKLPWRTTLAFAAASALAVALVAAPWVIRNERVMGAPVLRSNFWLETATGNHPAALSDAPQYEIWSRRVRQIHPYDGDAAIAAYRAAGGEIAYGNQLGRETKAWIRAHPADFLRLSLRHYRQFYVPDQWQFRLTNWPGLIPLRAIVMQVVSVLGLAGLFWGLVRRRRFYGYIAIYVAAVGLPYALVQPIPRFSYLVYAILTFLAAQLLVDAARLARRERRAILSPAPSGRAAP